MNDRLHTLEQEVERELARWAHRFEMRPPAELIGVVRAAVRCELDTAWLAAQLSPGPHPAVVRRVRSAIAAELAMTRARPASRLRRRISAQAAASLGAAAMLLLCIGVIWYAGTLRPAAPAGYGDVQQANLADLAYAELIPILADVQALEDDLSQDTTFFDDEDESLGDLVREMDRLIEEYTPARSTLHSRMGPEVLG